MDKLVCVLDGVVTLTEGRATRMAFNLKMRDFSTTKAYHDAFLQLRAKNSDIKESVLLEAFIDGIDIKNIKTTLAKHLADHPDTTLYDAFTLVDRLHEENSKKLEVNAVNFNKNNNKKNYNNKKFYNNRFQKSNNRSNNPNWRNNQSITCGVCSRPGHYSKNCRFKNQVRAFVATLEQEEEGNNSGAGNSRGDLSDNSGSNNTVSKACGGIENNIYCNLSKDDDFRSEKISFKEIVVSDETETPADSGISCGVKNSDSKFDLAVSDSKDRVTECGFAKEKLTSDDFFEYRINFQYHDLIRHDFVIKGPRGEATWTPFVDSGAQRSIMSRATAELLGLAINRKINFKVYGFDQQPSKLVVGFVDQVELYIPGTSQVIKFSPIIMDDPKANLCGLDIIVPSGGGAVVPSGDFFGARFVFNSERNSQTASNRLTSGEKICIKSGECRTVKINSCQLKGNLVIESNKRNNNLHVYDGVINHKTKCIKVFNTSSDKNITIQKGQNLGYAYSCDISNKQNLGEIPDIITSNTKKLNDIEIDKMIKSKVKHIVNTKTRLKLKNILKKNIDAFDIGSKAVGKFTKQVTINPENKNIELKPEKRRVFNPNVAEQVNKQLGQFFELGLIEDCNFPAVAPANIVAAKRKGSDKIRVCLDYRRLNEELPANFYPLPTKDKLLGRFGRTTGDTCLVKIDIASCFHNFELREQDRCLTAFYTDNGVMQWRRLPFGIRSAPGIVQKEITDILFRKNVGLDKETVSQVFIDDLLVKMCNEEIALKDTEIILQLLKKHGLVAKFEKCEFLLKNNCEYMGTILNYTDKGIEIQVNTKNLDAIKNIDTPTDQKSLKAYLGMVNYIANFIPNIHIELGPLLT